MHRRLAVARIGTVHHVVVNERGVVYHLHHQGGQIGPLADSEPGIDTGTEKDQQGPDTLAARRDDIIHDARDEPVVAVQGPFHELLILPEHLFERFPYFTQPIHAVPTERTKVVQNSERIRLRPPLRRYFTHISVEKPRSGTGKYANRTQ